jgi:hypothetical protein
MGTQDKKRPHYIDTIEDFMALFQSWTPKQKRAALRYGKRKR